MMSPRLGGALALAMFLALTAVNVMRIIGDPSSVRPMKSGDDAPAFELPYIAEDGSIGPEVLDLSALRGSIVVLDFWATWCGPCRASMPMLQSVANKMAGDEVRFISVNTEGPNKARQARTMANSLSPALPLVSDDGRVSDAYKVDMIPHMVVIDRSGKVRMVHRGLPSGGVEQLRKELEDVLGKLLSER